MSKFFGASDKKNGEVVSEYPSWYFNRHKEQLEESIEQKKRAIDRGFIPSEHAHTVRAEIEREERRLDEIRNSKPKLADGDRDKLAKSHKALKEEIRDSMFTRTDMKRGTASAQDEADRMVNPCVKIEGEALAMAKDLGMNIKDGKVSRNDATRIYKIGAKFLDEDSNVEHLRRERVTREV